MPKLLSKNILLIATLIIIMGVFIGCSSTTTNKEKEEVKNEPKEATKENNKKEQEIVKLNLGVVVTDQDPMYYGAQEFKKAVEEKTNKKVVVDLYHSSQLGDTKAMMELIKKGDDIATIADAGLLSTFVPEIGIINAPYIFENYDEAKKIVKSQEWIELENKLLATAKIKILSYNWYQGVRNMLTTKPINGIGDLKGLKIRTIDTPVFKQTIEGMGAVPIGQPWADVYGNIQNNVIDGCEAQHPAVYNAKLYEVLKYNTKTAHIHLLTGLVTSEAFFSKIPDEYKDIVLEEAFKAGEMASNKSIEDVKMYEDKMKEAGVIFKELDTAPFKKATEKVYSELKYEELREKFNKILGKE